MPRELVQISAAGNTLMSLEAPTHRARPQPRQRLLWQSSSRKWPTCTTAMILRGRQFHAELDEKLHRSCLREHCEEDREPVLSSTTQSHPYASLHCEKLPVGVPSVLGAKSFEAEQAEAASNPRASCLARQKVQRLTLQSNRLRRRADAHAFLSTSAALGQVGCRSRRSQRAEGPQVH